MYWKNKGVKSLISIIFFMLLWELLCKSNLYSSYLLPSPLQVLNKFINLTIDKTLPNHVFISLKRIFIGYLIALFLAFVFSFISLRMKGLMDYIDWIIQFFRNVPPLGLIPLLILWFGIGERSKLIVIILASFFPMFLSIEKGFKSTDVKLLELGESFGYSKWNIFKKIIFPSALGDILVGMRVGMGYSYRAIIGAEMIAASSGLGYMINFARSMSNTDVVILGIIVIGILGYLCDLFFKIIIRKLLRENQYE